VTLKSRLGSLFHALMVMVFGAFTALSSICPYLNPSGLFLSALRSGTDLFGLHLLVEGLVVEDSNLGD